MRIFRFGSLVCLALAVGAHGQGVANAIDQQINLRMGAMAASGLGVETALGTTLIVHLQQANGRSVSKQAYVRLSGTMIIARTTHDFYETKDARFTGLLPGDYVVEVEADGFQRGRTEVNVFRDGVTRAYVVLQPGGNEENATLRHPAAPLLPPKPRKELEAAIAGLRNHQPSEALKHVEWTLKHAGDHPDVQYIAALYYLNGKRDEPAARQHLDSAVKLFPDHTLARQSLGELLLSQNKAEESIPVLEKLVILDPDSWRAHWLLSEAFLMANRDPSAAKFHASKALSLNAEKATGAKSALVRAEARLNPPAADEKGSVVPVSLKAEGPSESFSSGLAAAEMPVVLSRWPADIDAVVPVADATTCVLPQVLEGASRRAAEFAEALEHFSAKENIEQEEMDAAGVPRRSGQHAYDYSAALERYAKDVFSIVEMRNGSYGAPTGLASPVMAKGVPAMGVIFGATYSPDFNFTCEGLGTWHGSPAWQVRFEQREDRPARLYQWIVEKHQYPELLKGRAWVSTGSFHILRVETDLSKPITAIQLAKHHMAIDYAPVKSASGKHELWLPSSAEVHSQYHGRFIRERHDFTDFQLFSVDTLQNIATPPATPPVKP